MKKILFPFVACVVALTPMSVFAHATPINPQPHSGAILQEAPTEVSITFSERLESGSSLIRVIDESGARVERGEAVVGGEGRTLAVPISVADGIYIVQWSVVSKDDGHFTRGSYAFSVGNRIPPSSSNEEVVQIATTKEATLLFIEFVGNSILWGLLALFLIARESRLRKTFSILSLLAVCAALIGAGGQLYLKSHELAGLHGVNLFEGLHLYWHTSAGFATALRAIALTVGGLLGALYGFRKVSTTLVVLGIPLLVFAYFRAIISHATANPFYPQFSVAVNFVHVIEKDLWFGALAVLCVLLIVRTRESIVQSLVPRTIAMLSMNLAILAASAGYIVWLHLKGFENIMGSNWGSAFLPLSVCAATLIMIHSVVVFVLRSSATNIKRYIVPLIGVEVAAAMLVVFFSSVVIITSPPPHSSISVFSERDAATVLQLSRSPFEDGMVLLTTGNTRGEPTVIIGARDGGLQPSLIQRFENGYVFPSSLIGMEETSVHVIVPRDGSYDAQATFRVSAHDFDSSHAHGRTLDLFTVVAIVLVLLGVCYSVWLRANARIEAVPLDLKFVGSRIFAAGLLACVVMFAAAGTATRVFNNPFKEACENDGNMWHIMQPTKAGVPVSSEAREGCMWGMGQYSYQFSDGREYEYLNHLGPATVTMESIPETARVGQPTAMTFTLTNADGRPATLLVDMEKYMHVVIVSKDQSVFAHIHPDDKRPLRPEEIERSTFTVEYAFPKAGEYLISVDYAHGTQLESKQFTVRVAGSPQQSGEVLTYQSPGTFGGYQVTMDSNGASAEKVTTLKFKVTKDGGDVTTLQPYLAAVSHISVVKNDFSAFIHTHGEYHAPGTVVPPVLVKNGKIVHSMAAMTAPVQFGPTFDAHVLFPLSGRYTVWAQFNDGVQVIPASFTVDVE